jgi:hypothetical protein
MAMDGIGMEIKQVTSQTFPGQMANRTVNYGMKIVFYPMFNI